MTHDYSFKGSRALTPVEVVDFTLEQLRLIFEIRAADIEIFIGVANGRLQLTGEVENACLNGAMVQVNLKTSVLDDVMEDESFQHAFGESQEDAA